VFAERLIAVVVPAKNEAAWIRSVVETMPSFVDDVIVIDDGSTDETAEIARAAGADVLRRERSEGVGSAIMAGYERALDRGADVVAVMAGDGQMCPDDLPRLLEPITSGRADYTKGDRFRHPDVAHTMPRARRLIGGVLSAATGLAIGQPGLSDSQSGYTAISRRALRAIDLSAVWPGYGYPNDLLGHLACAGMRIEDVVVRPVYRGEASGLRPRHVVTIAGLVVRVAARRLKSGATRRLGAMRPATSR
jgi:dolichol-phosphate mannosyltransferase